MLCLCMLTSSRRPHHARCGPELSHGVSRKRHGLHVNSTIKAIMTTSDVEAVHIHTLITASGIPHSASSALPRDHRRGRARGQGACAPPAAGAPPQVLFSPRTWTPLPPLFHIPNSVASAGVLKHKRPTRWSSDRARKHKERARSSRYRAAVSKLPWPSSGGKFSLMPPTTLIPLHKHARAVHHAHVCAHVSRPSVNICISETSTAARYARILGNRSDAWQGLLAGHDTRDGHLEPERLFEGAGHHHRCNEARLGLHDDLPRTHAIPAM